MTPEWMKTSTCLHCVGVSCVCVSERGEEGDICECGECVGWGNSTILKTYRKS